jgi:hypothetical protein
MARLRRGSTLDPETLTRDAMRIDVRTLVAGAAVVGAAGGLFFSDNTPDPQDAVAAPAPLAAAPAQTQTTAAGAAQQAARAFREGVGIESGLAKARATGALEVLSAEVSQQSDPNALRLAFQAYYNYQAKNPDKVRKPYLYFVDYGLDSSTRRGYVFDMQALTVVDGPFTVAHGRGSVAGNSPIPSRFSNRNGSNATSLGLYLAQETYAFRGKSAGKAYRSIGLRLTGVSGKYNSAARSRGVVVHGAPYVTATRAGRSEGCPAVEQHRAEKLIPQIANGGMVFLFSPLDRTWMSEDQWASL